MSAIMSDILHILMSPPPVAGSVLAVYLPLFTAHFIPKPSLHQPPGGAKYTGLMGYVAGDEEAKGIQ